MKASFLVLQSTFPLRFGINLVFYASIHRHFLSTAWTRRHFWTRQQSVWDLPLAIKTYNLSLLLHRLQFPSVFINIIITTLSLPPLFISHFSVPCSSLFPFPHFIYHENQSWGLLFHYDDFSTTYNASVMNSLARSKGRKVIWKVGWGETNNVRGRNMDRGKKSGVWGGENYVSRLENPCNQLLVSFLYLNVVFFLLSISELKIFQ